MVLPWKHPKIIIVSRMFNDLLLEPQVVLPDFWQKIQEKEANQLKQ